VRRLVLLLAIGATTAIAPAPAMALDFHAFTPQRPTYTHSDAQGRIDNQINYRATGGPRTQWGYRVSAPLVAAARGPATESVTLYCNGKLIPGYRDYHAGVPAGYFFHSSFGPLRTSCLYRLHITIQFKAVGGTAQVVVDHAFYITYV